MVKSITNIHTYTHTYSKTYITKKTRTNTTIYTLFPDNQTHRVDFSRHFVLSADSDSTIIKDSFDELPTTLTTEFFTVAGSGLLLPRALQYSHFRCSEQRSTSDSSIRFRWFCLISEFSTIFAGFSITVEGLCFTFSCISGQDQDFAKTGGLSPLFFRFCSLSLTKLYREKKQSTKIRSKLGFFFFFYLTFPY